MKSKEKKKVFCFVCSIKMSVKAKSILIFIQLHLLNGPDQLTVFKGGGWGERSANTNKTKFR